VDIAFSKILKNSNFEIFKFFGQHFKLVLIRSYKNIGLYLAYIGSTGLPEYPCRPNRMIRFSPRPFFKWVYFQASLKGTDTSGPNKVMS
jgi:hypothetical protein